MGLTPLDQIRTIFAGAIGKSGESRRQFLDQACGSDLALRAQVEGFLVASDHAPLAVPGSLPPSEAPHPAEAGGTGAVEGVDNPLPTTVAQPAVREGPGAVIGPYRLMEQIGEGGFGLVFVAEQQHPVRRKVAIKVIKPGMDTREVIARFEAERQALAMMDHPNIARVLDAGETGSGRPYFVMELVRGIPITNYCDMNRLTPRDRLGLFVSICHAVQHAHQKGVIHRDLKPSNVMVTLHDGVPVVKVIDFGVAKALNQQLTDRTVYTRFAEMIGTPLYMSPEQAAMSGLDVDTRSDVYSLGVLLYELLTGSTPFDRKVFASAAINEIRRIIREDEPPKPSTRLSRSGEALGSVSACRKTEPARLTKLVRGDLDWIVMKCLEKDRTQRYETANGLAMDVNRYLADEPVLAGPPGAGYRIRKFMHRHRAPVLAAGGAAVLIILAVVGLAVGVVLLRAQQKQTAQALQRETQERLQKEAALAAETRDKELTERALQKLTDEAVKRLLGRQGFYGPTEKQFLEDVRGLYEQFSQEQGQTESARSLRAEGYKQIAIIQQLLGQVPEAVRNSESYVGVLKGLAADYPTKPQYRADLARGRNMLGLYLDLLGRRAESEEQLRQGVALNQALPDSYWMTPPNGDGPLHSYLSLGEFLIQSDRDAEAEQQLRMAINFGERLVAQSPNTPTYCDKLATSCNILGSLLAKLNRYPEAEQLDRRAVGLWEKLATDYPNSPEARSMLTDGYEQLGLLLAEAGRPTEAQQQYRQAILTREKLTREFPAFPRYRQTLGIAYDNLGTLLKELGDPRGAEEQYRLALAIQEKLVDDFANTPQYLYGLGATHNNLGIALVAMHKQADAEPHFRRSITLLENLGNSVPGIPDYRGLLAEMHHNLANVLDDLGKTQESEEHYQLAIAMLGKLTVDSPAVPKYRYGLATAHGELAVLLVAASRQLEAEQHFLRATEGCEKLAADFPNPTLYRIELAKLHFGLGDLLRGLARPKEAAVHLRQAVAAGQKLVEESPSDASRGDKLANSVNTLGLVLKDLGAHAEAREQYRDAIKLFDKLLVDAPDAADYKVGLAGAQVNLGNELAGDEGGPQPALDLFARAIQLLEPIVAGPKPDPSARLFLYNAYRSRALVLQRLLRFEQEAEDWQHAADLAAEGKPQQLLRLQQAISLLRCRKGFQAAAVADGLVRDAQAPDWVLYSAANVLAQASAQVAGPDERERYADAAVQALRRSIAAGFKDIEQLKKTPDLDPLREREDFRKLLADLPATRPAGGK